jgi:predicted protein tyrosine phosphatase
MCRSKTAAWLFSKVARIRYGSVYDVTYDDISWADRVYVMEKWHKEILTHYFDSGSKIFVLGIPDNYVFGDSELIALLLKRVNI